MADKQAEKTVKEVRAYARGIKISPRKVRLVVDLIRHLPIYTALDQLAYVNKKAADPIGKLINSGLSNATNNHQIDEGRLFIKTLTVDEGIKSKRYRPRAHGRAFPIRRRTSNINLIIGVSDKLLASSKRKRKDPSADKAEAEPQKPEEKASTQESDALKISRSGKKLAFWKRGKIDTEQPPAHKGDTAGKTSHTTFDRRGNM